MKGQVQAIVESRFPSQPLSTGPAMAPWGMWERGGAVVECRPHDQEVVGSIPGQVTT
jgi:hypothetical protein